MRKEERATGVEVERVKERCETKRKREITNRVRTVISFCRLFSLADIISIFLSLFLSNEALDRIVIESVSEPPSILTAETVQFCKR